MKLEWKHWNNIGTTLEQTLEKHGNYIELKLEWNWIVIYMCTLELHWVYNESTLEHDWKNIGITLKCNLHVYMLSTFDWHWNGIAMWFTSELSLHWAYIELECSVNINAWLQNWKRNRQLEPDNIYSTFKLYNNGAYNESTCVVRAKVRYVIQSKLTWSILLTHKRLQIELCLTERA